MTFTLDANADAYPVSDHRIDCLSFFEHVGFLLSANNAIF